MLTDMLQLLPTTLIDGLVLGLIYASIALGYTMVYGVLGMINFAHSEVFMVGAIVAIEVLVYGLAGTGLHPLIQLMAAVVVGGLAAGFLAVAIERVAYRPLRARKAPRLVPLITTIGVSLFLQDSVRFIESLFGQFIRPFPAFSFFNREIVLSDTVFISNRTLTIVTLAVALLAGLYHMVHRTRLGKAIRAVALDQKTSQLMGINVNRVIAATFFIGGVAGGVAGVLYALQFGRMDPFAGFIPGIKAFTAAVLGGIGSIEGAVLGGLLLGIIEVVLGTYIPMVTNNAIGSEYKDIIAFSILILILIFRPNGLVGRAYAEKV
ncbi:branched-chain amino acid ABC transporter permease [Labrys neptuniae]